MLRTLKIIIVKCLSPIVNQLWMINCRLSRDKSKESCGGPKWIRPENPAYLLRKLSGFAELKGLELAIMFQYILPDEKIEDDLYERIVEDIKEYGMIQLRLEVPNA